MKKVKTTANIPISVCSETAVIVLMPKIRVRYFGELREILGVKEEEYEVTKGTTLADFILGHVPERHKAASENWKKALFRMVRGEIATNKDGTPVLGKYLILIRGRTSSLRYGLRDGDEIAVLPPSGGG